MLLRKLIIVTRKNGFVIESDHSGLPNVFLW